jgi:hypothetical protein
MRVSAGAGAAAPPRGCRITGARPRVLQRAPRRVQPPHALPEVLGLQDAAPLIGIGGLVGLSAAFLLAARSIRQSTAPPAARAEPAPAETVSAADSSSSTGASPQPAAVVSAQQAEAAQNAQQAPVGGHDDRPSTSGRGHSVVVTRAESTRDKGLQLEVRAISSISQASRGLSACWPSVVGPPVAQAAPAPAQLQRFPALTVLFRHVSTAAPASHVSNVTCATASRRCGRAGLLR